MVDTSHPAARVERSKLYTVFEPQALGQGLTNAAHPVQEGSIIKINKDRSGFKIAADAGGKQSPHTETYGFNGIAKTRAPGSLGLEEPSREAVQNIPNWRTLVSPTKQL